MIVDSHCHLDFFSDEDLDSFISDNFNKGLVAMHSISTDIRKFAQIKKIGMRNNVFISIGQHPCDLIGEDYNYYENIVSNSNANNLISIGETGFDFYRNTIPKKAQERSFEQHVRASVDLSLPMVIHSRCADTETIESIRYYKREFGDKLSGVMHCFNGDIEFAKKALDLGFFISFSGITTFKNSSVSPEVIKFIPIDRMLIETDAPYLSPVPVRGKRNVPSNVIYVAKFIASVLSVRDSFVFEHTTNNFFTLFKKARLSL